MFAASTWASVVERDLALEGRAARKHRVDRLVAERDPVADRRKVGPGRRLVPEAARNVRALLAALGEHVVLAAVLSGHARRNAVVVRLERGREAAVPAEVVQVQAKLLSGMGEPPGLARGSGARV
jgi:hypothetical protein